ncbi:FAD dependent oxidoreductase [Acrodontium crateriforme]|uniref:FAD dependent oxidoreductase n=1 Tax=Acrodontium crateriforme TaxID=150365 RepID=A0AAQ3RC60_9PEZI|nr:FAD dependent oxidoreductase [Acrodontium crateriforme]
MSSGYQRRLDALTEKLQKDPGLPVPNPTVSYWQLPPLESVARRQSAILPETSDVVIIGSGITGCSVARHLLTTSDSISVTLLEARETTSGATGRNGGHIQAVPEETYDELLPVLGLEATKDVIHFTLANVEALLQLAKTLSPELQSASEVRPVDSLTIFINDDKFAHLKQVVEALDRDDEKLAGRGKILDADTVREKFGFTNSKGGYLHPAGAAWPYRLITGLFAELLQQYPKRFHLEALTPVQAINTTEEGIYMIQTPRGEIRAKEIVHATNGHASHLNPGLRGPIFPARGQMTAQIPTTRFGVQGDKLSWGIEYGIGFDYITQSAQSGEIFLGGGFLQADMRGLGELGNINDDEQSTLALAHLNGIMNTVAGQGNEAHDEMKAAWTGIMGFTTDGLPLVGKLPREASLRSGDGEWIAAGFNGYGMVNTWLCGKHIADLILGKTDPEHVPAAYAISAERLAKMGANVAAERFLNHSLGLE